VRLLGVHPKYLTGGSPVLRAPHLLAPMPAAPMSVTTAPTASFQVSYDPNFTPAARKPSSRLLTPGATS